MATGLDCLEVTATDRVIGHVAGTLAEIGGPRPEKAQRILIPPDRRGTYADACIRRPPISVQISFDAGAPGVAAADPTGVTLDNCQESA